MAMTEMRSEEMTCQVVGRLGREPEATTTLDGVPVCRLVVVKKAAGPASNPVRVGLYVKGELAKRCRSGLHEGDLIKAHGELAARRAGSKARPGYPEVLVPDVFDGVRLRERAGVAA
jgi:hypothetical protein